MITAGKGSFQQSTYATCYAEGVGQLYFINIFINEDKSFCEAKVKQIKIWML